MGKIYINMNEPSYKNGVVLLLAMAIFGALTVLTVKSNSGYFATMFCTLFTIILLSFAAYNFVFSRRKDLSLTFENYINSRQNRVIVNFPSSQEHKQESGINLFCPYCGAPAAPAHKFCNGCGRKLP